MDHLLQVAGGGGSLQVGQPGQGVERGGDRGGRGGF